MTRPARLLAVLCLLVAASLHRGDVSAREPALCTQTAHAALSACRHRARDDFWIAVGHCLNHADPAERRTCRLAAKQLRGESDDECGSQFDAREELCGAVGEAAYDPAIDPARFLAPDAAAASPNPYFPLVPGSVWTYRGPGERVTVTVTGGTRVILGVTCRVVRDAVDAGGVPVEDTEDYFAQDVEGNVWYFGELSQSFEAGRLTDVQGSWTAGVDGARPGIVMRATPQAGETYRQEFALGDAEDAARIVSLAASATVPGASCSGTCVQTLDFTPLEPDAQEHKFYAPGVGPVLEVDLETGERLELESFTAG